MATVEERLTQLETQQALQTEALLRLNEGRWTGADGSAGIVVQLKGGTAPGFAPVEFPKAIPPQP